MATKVASFVWLNGDDSDGTLAMPLSNVPILTLSTGEAIVLWQYKQALSVDRITDPEKKKQRYDEGVIDMKIIENSINQTQASDFIAIMDDLQQCLDNYQAVCDEFETRCEPDDVPPSSNIKAALSESLNDIRTLSHDVVSRVQAIVEDGDTVTSDSNDTLTVSGQVTDRESAMRTLLSVADYFRRTEPQSPLPYLLERAVRWGRMSLGDLLGEVILDERVRGDVFQLTGIEVNKENE